MTELRIPMPECAYRGQRFDIAEPYSEAHYANREPRTGIGGRHGSPAGALFLRQHFTATLAAFQVRRVGLNSPEARAGLGVARTRRPPQS